MARFMGLTPEGFLPPVAREDVLTEVFAGVDTQIDARTTKPRTTAINVTAPPYNADPTGLTDATQAIQNAVNTAAEAGKGAVYIPAGSYRVSPPFIEMKPEVLIHGDGDSTVIFVDASAPAPVEKIGVFHIGTYNNRAQDPKMYRSSLRDLMIKTVDGSQAHQPAIENVCGVILNTDLGSSTHDPDAVHSLRGLTIWDMHIGMAILGRDDQGMKISDIRIRGGNEMGLLVGKPSNHPEVVAGVPGGPGAADNKFLNMDVSSSNKLGGVHAGIEIYTSNSKFVNSTSWYNRRFGSFAGTQGTDRSTYYDGAGWYVKGTKNVFVSCTAQENGGHGFITQYPGCQFIGCIAESNSWHDSVNGDALVNEASGFFVCNGASDTQVISARSNNARGADKGQAYGYVFENYAKNQWVQGTADQNFSGAVKFGTNMASLGKDVVVRVGDTTLNWAAGPLSTSATDEVRVLAKAEALALKADEPELDDVVRAADLADYAKITALESFATQEDLQSKADKSELQDVARAGDLLALATKTELSGYAKSSALTSLAKTTDLATKADATHTHEWGDVAGKPDVFPAASHTHTTAQVDGLAAALADAGKVQSVLGKTGAITAQDFIDAGLNGASGSLELQAAKDYADKIGVRPESYGAAGDGVAYDQAAVQSALDNAFGAPVVLTTGRTYRCPESLVITAGVTVEGQGAVIDQSGMDAGAGLYQKVGILARGSLGEPVKITGQIAQWGKTITGVASTAGLKAGDLVRVSNREKSVTGNTMPNDLKGELVTIKSVDSPSQVTLDEGLILPYADDGYLELRKITPVENVHLRNITIRMGGAGTMHNGVMLLRARGCSLSHVQVLDAESTGISLDHAFECRVDQPRVSGSVSPAPPANTGYGVAVLNASKHIDIDRLFADNCRAAVDGGGNYHTAFVNITKCMARNTSTAAFATHEPCFYWTFEGCVVSSAFAGFVIRGQYCTIEGGVVTDVVNAGVLVYADYGVTTQDGVTVRGLTINKAGTGVYFRGEKTTGSTVDCVKTGVIIDGVTIRNTTYNGVLVKNFDGATLTNCDVRGTGDSAYLLSGLLDTSRSKNLAFSNNRGAGSTKQTVVMKWVDGVTGSGGSYENTPLPGVDITGCSGVTLGHFGAGTNHATGPALRVESSSGIITHPTLTASSATKYVVTTSPGFSVDRSSGRSTGLRLIDLGAAGTLKLSREGNTVTGTCDPWRPQTTGTVKVAGLPAGWEPAGTATSRAVGMEGSAARLVTVTGGTTKAITMSAVAAANSFAYFTIRWQVVSEFPEPAEYPGIAG